MQNSNEKSKECCKKCNAYKNIDETELVVDKNNVYQVVDKYIKL